MLNILSAEVRGQSFLHVANKVLIHLTVLIKHTVNMVHVLFDNLFGREEKSPYWEQWPICCKFIYLYTQILDEGNQDSFMI